MKMFTNKEGFNKILKVINSVKTYDHAIAAQKMIDNYAKNFQAIDDGWEYHPGELRDMLKDFMKKRKIEKATNEDIVSKIDVFLIGEDMGCDEEEE